jgi:hypothetical protein
MSSSGITAINSGPLIIRTYNDNSSNNTYVVGKFDNPVSTNTVLSISTNGLLVPTSNLQISSVNASSIFSNTAKISTSYLSSVFAINSTIDINNQVNIESLSGGTSLSVTGTALFTEPGATTTPVSSLISVWGLSSGDPINRTFTGTTTYTIQSTISKINFQLIGSGGSTISSNTLITNEDLPGYGSYVAGTLAIKQGDSLCFTVGSLGSAINGTSLIYISTTGPGSAVSTLVAVAGGGGGNGYAPSAISSSSGGGHGGGGNGAVIITSTDYIAAGTQGYDGLSTIGGVIVSDTDGGQGGQITSGGSGGGAIIAGSSGSNPTLITNLSGAGIVSGGAGGISTRSGGLGGGGYSGGGGGGGGTNTSAGGGGGGTYIATSTLSGFLSNVVCLGGQFLSENNAIPFGGGYGLPNNSGAGAIFGYTPNDTIYTNGDIQCRVLRYEQLDPPISGGYIQQLIL